MKILVADKFEQMGIDGLKALGCEVVLNPDLKDDALVEAIKNEKPQVLVVRSTKVTAPMLENSTLGLVIRAGAGYNTIDVDAASRMGIFVANCPGKNSIAVAELAFGLIIAADRKIPDNVIELRKGNWNKKRFSKARGLYGRTLGLVGMGNIGQEMITRAKGFGMSVNAFSRWMTPDVAAALGIGRANSLLELAQSSDFVSVHVSLRPETRGMLGEDFFQAMRPGSVFVNTSRAEVVDQAALLRAVQSGRIFACLDVFEGEPSTGEGTYEGPLKDQPNVYCTHHIGASTDQAQEAVASEVIRIVKEYKATGQASNVVNVSKGENVAQVLVVRHADKVGVLAHVLDALKQDSISVQEMENIVLGGAQAAIAQLALDKPISDSAHENIRRHPDIFDVGVFSSDATA
jgi:D-3-phosphoglycerate dehydrogenase